MNKKIKKGPFKGFVVIGPGNLNCVEPKNYHVLRAKITEYEDGTRGWSPLEDETICGESIKGLELTALRESQFFNSEVSRLRTYLADLQNRGTRICGTCVSHFYADYQQKADA